MPRIDVMQLAGLLRDAAAAEIRPRFRRLDPATVRIKSNPTDLVTEADTEAERRITGEIAARWPGTLVVGEEAVAADPGLLEALPSADLAVTLDPVDGTANFAAGLPLFAVMAAVLRRGEVVAGVLYDPMGDDWVLAERGGGAWLRRPDGESRRLAVAAAPALADMIGHVSMAFLERTTKPRVLANLAKIRISANYRCAGHDYRTFASGHCHFISYSTMMPWDHCPGTLIAAEAGAHVARLDGSAYRAGHHDRGLLLAPDRDSWELVRREIFVV